MSSSAVESYPSAPTAATLDTARPQRASPSTPPLFLPDETETDSLGRAGVAGLLASLLSHRDAGTPFLVAVVGSAGSGKSSLLRMIVERIRSTGDTAGPPAAAPARTVAVEVDAGAGADPASTILAGVLAGLSTSYPHLAEEAVYAGGDPVKMARAAGERLNDLRRQLDTERQGLDELSGRRARLAETVLFNTPGSQIETYARQNRGRIETRLRAFGLPAAEPIATYKDLVREASETGAGASRLGLGLRAIWSYKGQGRLIVLAILLLVVGWGSTAMAENQEGWVGWLHSFGDGMDGVSRWAEAHADWLAPLGHAAYALAALAVLVNIIRAIRFLQPIFRGASLLGGDLDGRRRDLDAMLAHQTRRVDHLTSEVDAAVRSTDVAERRVEARKSAGLLQPALILGHGEEAPSASAYATAEAVLVGIADAMAGRAAAEPDAAAPVAAPDRIVVAVDELDRLPAAAAAAFLETAQRLLRRRGFATVAAFGRGHVLSGFSETDPGLAAAHLGRAVQLSYDLDADEAAGAALGPSGQDGGAGLDRPWTDIEDDLVRVLAPFAGPNPRNLKRFVNSVRVARADPRLAADATTADLAVLAVALALDATGAGVELGSLDDVSGEPSTGPLASALAAAREVVGTPFSIADGRRGLKVARIYGRHGL